MQKDPSAGGPGDGGFARQISEAQNRFVGKFRGKVTGNVDPLNLARIQVDVPAVPYSNEIWAMPCVPYAGEAVGLHAIPPLGSHVWVEFEGGDPSFPIWTGCYWESDEFTDPKDVEADEPPLVKMLRTAASTFMLDDKEQGGSIKLEIAGPAVETAVTMVFDSNGATFTCGKCSISMHPENGITLKVSDTTITMTDDGIELQTGTITGKANEDVNLTAGSNMSLKPGSAFSLEAGSSVDIKAGSSANVEASGSMSVKSGAAGTLEAGASLDLKGGGPVSITGPMVNIN